MVCMGVCVLLLGVTRRDFGMENEVQVIEGLQCSVGSCSVKELGIGSRD